MRISLYQFLSHRDQSSSHYRACALTIRRVRENDNAPHHKKGLTRVSPAAVGSDHHTLATESASILPVTVTSRSLARTAMNGQDGSNSHRPMLNLGARGWAW